MDYREGVGDVRISGAPLLQW